MVLVPGGPFLTRLPRARRLVAAALPDFAIGRFPVTLAAYARFLDALPPDERARRMPGGPDRPLLERSADDERWRLAAHAIDGAAARRRVPAERALELAVHGVSFYSALAYARWLAGETGLPYRLPTDLEWDKAMRGADGRAYPMGEHIDPCFAKLRTSRPEAPQPEPVGAFELDESPYGVRDLAGSFGDWTATPTDGGPAPSLADEGRAEAAGRQLYWRGGSWGVTGLTPEMRYPLLAEARNAGVSFRLVLGLEGSSELGVEPMDRA
ncbi:MAG: SUMF1/EgtB/PvdO family nonheme iron enzyme [Polyangiaceae bacterium]|nr:SUMF1/EgtB/PvdO family nonheme iron enzyme [Polyangiaceae bacterium]